jgi:protein phosphatase
MAVLDNVATVVPGISLGYAGQSCGKELSEDFFDLACPDAQDLAASGLVFALADGMSGGAGRRAAETCVRSVLSDFYAAPAAWGVGYRLDKIIASVNGWLLAHNVRSDDAQHMFSTLSVLVLRADEFHIAHVGDTRIYRVRNGSSERMTTDHVWPRRDMRNVLRRAVGLDQHLVVDSFCADLAAGDRFAMVSDGVSEVLGETALQQMLVAASDPRALAERLVQASTEKQRSYYGRNDATAAVIDVAALPSAMLR